MKLCRSTLRSKQKNQEKKIIAVPLYSGPVEMLAIPPCGASSNIALWRAKIKPPVELVVGDLRFVCQYARHAPQPGLLTPESPHESN